MKLEKLLKTKIEKKDMLDIDNGEVNQFNDMLKIGEPYAHVYPQFALAKHYLNFNDLEGAEENFIKVLQYEDHPYHDELCVDEKSHDKTHTPFYESIDPAETMHSRALSYLFKIYAINGEAEMAEVALNKSMRISPEIRAKTALTKMDYYKYLGRPDEDLIQAFEEMAEAPKGLNKDIATID